MQITSCIKLSNYQTEHNIKRALVGAYFLHGLHSPSLFLCYSSAPLGYCGMRGFPCAAISGKNLLMQGYIETQAYPWSEDPLGGGRVASHPVVSLPVNP